jgi:2-methylcitrate dehydratase PrpD
MTSQRATNRSDGSDPGEHGSTRRGFLGELAAGTLAGSFALGACHVTQGERARAPAAPRTPAGNLTRQFVRRVMDWRADDPEVLARARLLAIDGVASASAGISETGPSVAAELVRADANAPAASVIGRGFSTSVSAAARVNAMAMNVLDFEPMWQPANHALSCILPALLALAEQREAQDGRPRGRDVLRALARGIEVQGRLLLAAAQADSLHPSGLHPPGLVGSIASAVATGDLLGVSPEVMLMAVGIAASRLGGLVANAGSMTKALHCGDAAAHGLEATLMAVRGFTSDPDALGAPQGWGPALFGAKFDPAPLIAPVEIPRILSPGSAWKLFPSQYGTHFAIAAALEARTEIRDPSTIAAVVLRTPPAAYLDRPVPASGLAGKTSWQYTTAAALLDGKVDLETFSDRRRFAPDMPPMLSRIRLAPDPAIPVRFDASHVVIEVRLANGAVVERRCDAPLGHWRRPAPVEAVRDKARGLMAGAFGAALAARLLDQLEAPLEQLAVREIMSLARSQRDGTEEHVRGT